MLSPGYVSTEQSGVHPKAVREFQASSVPLGRVSNLFSGVEENEGESVKIVFRARRTNGPSVATAITSAF